MIKSLDCLVLGLVMISLSALPYKIKIALANSNQVGRIQDPMIWKCIGCNSQTKPYQSHVIQEKAHDIRAIFSIYQQYSVLAFRYTASLENVWQDLLWSFQIQDDNAPQGCKVQTQYEMMWNSIRNDTLDDLKNSPRTNILIITGISLGGALAHLAYVDIYDQRIFSDLQIITFGAPRVGNNKWAQWFNTITFTDRILIKGDPIAVLPICFIPFCTYMQPYFAIVCDQDTLVCTKKCHADEQQMEQLGLQGSKQMMKKALMMAWKDDDESVDGIYDHIVGYQKLYDYDYVEC